MLLQCPCPRCCKVTLVAFFRLLSTMCCQMLLQITCIWGCKVTLAAFLTLFSSVCFQMYPQAACPRWCKVTLAALVWLISIVCPSQCTCNISIAFTWNTLSRIFIHDHYVKSVVPSKIFLQTENKSIRHLINWTKMESENHPHITKWFGSALHPHSPTSTAKQEAGSLKAKSWVVHQWNLP